MRFLFRWTFRLLILILVLAIGLFLTKDALTNWWIVSEFREQGMDVQIGQLEIGFPLNSSIAANKITVFNLPEYGGSAMLKIDDLYIDCDFSELMNFRRKLKPHFRQIRIRIKEFNLVETNQGSRNLISLPDAIAKTTAQLALDDSPLYFTVGNLNFSWSNLSFTSISANGSTTGSNKMTVNIENHISQDLKTLKDLRPLFTKISKPIRTSLVTKLFGRFFD